MTFLCVENPTAQLGGSMAWWDSIGGRAGVGCVALASRADKMLALIVAGDNGAAGSLAVIL